MTSVTSELLKVTLIQLLWAYSSKMALPVHYIPSHIHVYSLVSRLQKQNNNHKVR